MVSESVIRKRLERLEESLKRLRSKQKVSMEEFVKNWEIQDIVLREFEVAIEACVDIASHIISEKGWKPPEKYADIPEILAEKGVIPKEYGKLFKRIISFRNIIVHEYLYIDFKKVYENLQKIDELGKFALYIENFLEREQ
ncbi:DUF86 domain-containing protein [Candidatus Aminicenantes bacterium AC-335-B20]|nr:DUF86 domain-containing protein [SCandidatus Aminicenantes bacterium Aminicenantia_JdfR_composite]MCP2596701.1 DUF86 domain-containing protein [Candidatus Aminicenantes bacterium AC-335-G13]MCP2598944.1 DUF86 domain-containing protein [Candidatus Aminicenantes bacterium AC-335-B20]